MNSWVDFFILGLVLTNFRLLGTNRLAALIDTIRIQACFLAVIPLALNPDGIWSIQLMGLLLVTIAVKALLLPWLLRRAMRSANVQREIEPFISYSSSLLGGVVLLGFSVLIARPLQHHCTMASETLLTGALFTILVGLLMIISRRKALTQVIGYLTMENGIYAVGAALAIEQPLVVEMGVLLDVLVAVFVMGITMQHISREFDHIDTDRLAELRD